MFDTPRAALKGLTDDTLLERVAVKVLRVRYPELRITGPSGDLSRDGFGRRLFGEDDEIVLWVSCEEKWTKKLRRDRAIYGKQEPAERPKKAIFVTTRSTRQTDQKRLKAETLRTLGIALEIVDLNELSLDLESDELHRIAEFDLGVRPRAPRVLQPPTVFWENQKLSIPGIGSALVGRVAEMQQLQNSLKPASGPAAGRIVVVEGPGGIGKTRLAVEAANSCATTLVAGTGTSLAVSNLVDVPVHDPSIVVVDDAHRSPDLTGLAAMLQDPKFVRVKVVLTVRPGTLFRVLASLGQERAKVATVKLAPLDRVEIDQIVTGHGLMQDSFRLHVVGIAGGNPGLAHAACDVALSQSTYHWSDTAMLLRDLVDNRLLSITSAQKDELRATAVALALLTTVEDGEQLATLAGVVSMLPPEPHRLDILLEDLSDAGVAVGQPYTLRPDVVAPVLAAAALDPQARAKIKVLPALKVLGQAACWSDPDDARSGDGGLLGIAPLPPGRRVHSARLAAQLALLAQASQLRPDAGCVATLHQAVRELVPDEADFDNWLDILTLAAQVAPTSPTLLDELRDELVRQWPPAPTTNPWTEDPLQRHRSETKAFLEQAVAVAEEVGRVDAARAVRWALDCVWLSHPVLGKTSLDVARQAITSLVKVNIRASGETWERAFLQREQVLDAVLRWGHDRYLGPPYGLALDERDLHQSTVPAQVQMSALRPFLSVVTEDRATATPDSENTFVWTHYVLPDDPRTIDGLAAAIDAVETMLDQLDLHTPEVRGVLEMLAQLPRELRAEGARGLSDKPMPGYAIDALNAAAIRVSDVLVSHWQALPLIVRRAAAEAAARAGGRPPGALTDLAEAGDPVATAVVADAELLRLLTVVPVEVNQFLLDRDGHDAALVIEEYRQRAVQLGEQLSLDEAIQLLSLIDVPPSGPFASQCLDAFGRTVSSNASDAGKVLAALAEGPFFAAPSLLTGLFCAHPVLVFEWLSANVAVPHIAELAVIIADELFVEQEAVLFHTIIDTLVPVADANTATGTATLRPDSEHDVGHKHRTDADRAQLLIAQRVSLHLTFCRRPRRERLTLLVELGAKGPADALPVVLAAVGQILQFSSAEGAVCAEVAQELRVDLVRLLRRALINSDDTLGSDVNDDIAFAGVALAKVAPEEVADLLIERVRTDVPRLVPFTWGEVLDEVSAEQRESLARALQQRVEQEMEAGVLTGQKEARALSMVSRLAVGTASWAALARRWASGGELDRVRAAQVLEHGWHDPTWQALVPDLIDAGLHEQATAGLLNGLVLNRGAASASDIQIRINALQPMLEDKRSAVRDFATKAERNLKAMLDFLG